MIPFLLDTNVMPSGGEAAAQTTQAAAQTGLFGTWGAQNPWMLIIIYCVALVAIMYFLSVRPTQKREKRLAELRNAIQVGDSVITNSGIYGKVVDETYDCWIIEFGMNRGVRIPVSKVEVYGKAEPNLTKNPLPQDVEETEKKKGFFK